MNPQDLWRELMHALRMYARTQVLPLIPQVTPTPIGLGDRLLGPIVPPPGNALVDLVRDMVGDLTTDSPIRTHGWQRKPGGPFGIALVMTDPAAAGEFAVVALTPNGGADPIVDVVVTPGPQLRFAPGAGEWTVSAMAQTPQPWEVSFGAGEPALGTPVGATATISITRKVEFQAGMSDGPGLRISGFTFGLTVPGVPSTTTFALQGLKVSLLPADLGRLVGAKPGGELTSSVQGGDTITVTGDPLDGLRFAQGGLRVPLPVRFSLPGLASRGIAATLSADGGLRLGLLVSLTARLPGVPLTAVIDNAGFTLPLEFPGDGPPRLGILPADVAPDGIGVSLQLPPVSGGGVVRRCDDGSYAGIIALDMGFVAVQAVARFGHSPTTFIAMLGVVFPPPGIQVGFGFALDAIGGLVGINHRIDAEALRQLVSDGHADRILFPDNIVERADEVIGALSAAFPRAGGRFVIAPMVRLTWGGRMVSLSGALVLELPAPVQAVILGRLLVALPDPVVPLVRLQASILGRFDPSVPLVEVLVSLAGSSVLGVAVRGEIYLLIRGGDQPEFVLSAGGFHPRYRRPAGVPALQRLEMDLAPGGAYRMRMQAYFAVTSNSVQFGGQLHLQAMIAGCGVEGWLGLDALFMFEPTFSFSVAIRAGIAVRAFGVRLASVGLSFTLEGPSPWHAFGTGSVSVLFWDASLDFDIEWGDRPAVAAAQPGPDRIPADLSAAIGRPKSWVAERPTNERTGLTFTRAATDAMAAGALVHPDAVLRVDQSVIPLDVDFSRYGQRIDAQRWSIAEVRVGSATLAPTPETALFTRFVRGQFFVLDEDEQLTAPPTAVHASGTRVQPAGAVTGAGHVVDDSYETAYEPAQPQDRRAWHGSLHDEIASRWIAGERLARWMSADAGTARIVLNAPTLSVAADGPVMGFAAGAPLTQRVELAPDADTWRILHDQGRTGAGPRRLLESWELP
ncbi:DUF6603 domain-containing protein [uncultured Microbacterium sp.]|uniref:DUF6603 domain-containing protein n=1 Tax=uncultured Microbacterium sp. TaxID=191216 RepID=UPI0028D4C527|nr:DUF6603 domain-containing protein [uncultured Microbacterium sp.]